VLLFGLGSLAELARDLKSLLDSRYQFRDIVDVGQDVTRARQLARDLAAGRELALDLLSAYKTDIRTHDDVAFETTAVNLELANRFAVALSHDMMLRRRGDVEELAAAVYSALGRARDLAAVFNRGRIRRAENGKVGHALARALARDLRPFLKLDSVTNSNRYWAFDHLDLRPFSTSADDLDHLLYDFVGADLREVSLTGISLVGVRWSSTTRWPLQWEEQIRRVSVEIGPDLFEVRPGTATVTDDAGLVRA
jgi:hypothetical protein